MSVGLVWKSAAKSNEKLVNQKYATLFISWMPFRQFDELRVLWKSIFWPKSNIIQISAYTSKHPVFLCQRKEKWQILFWKCFDMKYFNFYVQSLHGEKSVFQSCNAIFVNKFHYFAVECLKWRPRGIKSLHSGFRGTMYFTRIGSKLKSQHYLSHSTKSIYYCSLLFHQNNWVQWVDLT